MFSFVIDSRGRAGIFFSAIVLVSLLCFILVYALPFSGEGIGALDNPYNITNCTQLQEMNESLSSNFSLVNNIDCSDTVNWDGGAGFGPVGNDVNKFIGTFFGNNKTISNLVINRHSSDNVGLFGHAYVSSDFHGRFYDVSLDNINIAGAEKVGGLVGYGPSVTIDNSYATGNVSGTNFVGGLVGNGTSATINNSYATGNVTGNSQVGGLVGDGTSATISNCYWNNRTNGPECNGTGDYTGDCTAVQDNKAYFYDVANPPMSVWDFKNIWNGIYNLVSFPVLRLGLTSDNEAPIVSLDGPVDNGYDSDGVVVFNYTATDVSGIYSCDLWGDWGGGWHLNESFVSPASGETNGSNNIILEDGQYVWTVYCNDTGNNYNSTVGNFTLTVDRVAPVTPTLTAPSDTSINPRDSISYSCQSSDATAGISKWTWTLTRPQSGGTVTKTGGEVTSNSQTFSGDDTNLAGTYTVVCEAEDKAGHKSSSSSSFSVYYSHAPEGAGGGVGPSAAAQLDFTIQEEVKIKEPQGAIMTFTLDGTAIHTIRLREVNAAFGRILVVIESNPIEVWLYIGETKEVDVDRDGINDISVTLNGIGKNGWVDLTTKRLTPLPAKEEAPVEEVTSEEAPEEAMSPTEEAPSKAWLWILIIVILIVMVLGYFMIKKKGYDIVNFEEKKSSAKKKKK